MNRMLTEVLRRHFAENRQMAFVSGPRHVGKSTLARALAGYAFFHNWDRPSDRALILAGSDALAEHDGLAELRAGTPILCLDELHKYPRWKNFLKGFFDTWGDRCHVLVTGSARLDVYKRGGDSLMGRYFPFRLHPLSLAEVSDPRVPDADLVRLPAPPDPEALASLLRWGGYPEPFLKAKDTFHRRWRDLRNEQLFREDLRDATRIQETAQVQVLAGLLADRAGQLVNYSALASATRISEDTARRWLAVLESFYYGFTLRPWFRNVNKSLRKQPKFYLWDWSVLPEGGARVENFIACHLLKAVHAWTDLGLGRFDLHYLRDTAGREVGFLVSRDRQPWFLVEAKSADRSLNPALDYYQKATGAKHAFQIAMDLPFVERDCFGVKTPVRVPAATLLSQLL